MFREKGNPAHTTELNDVKVSLCLLFLSVLLHIYVLIYELIDPAKFGKKLELS